MGGGPLERDLRALASRLGLGTGVAFAGFRPDDRDVVRLLALASVFCLPTRREGFGVAFAEAMAMGCPVVGPRMEPVSSVVLDGTTGLLVTPEDPAAYTAAIDRLLTDEPLRARLGAAGRRHAAEALDPRGMYEAVTAIYRAVRRPA
jgi:glycosyltransferase involved in cell wall biosynthesis